MAKGKRRLEELAGKLDLILEVRDARAPGLTSSPLIHELSKIKPVWTVLSKEDLADRTATGEWLSFLRKSSGRAWALDLLKGKISSVRKDLLVQKPAHRELRLAVVGIPNVGKSALLNLLVGSRRAPVGGIPGVTRGVSWYKGQGCLVVDTPGILDARSGKKVHQVLAFLGCTKPDVIGGYDLLGMELLELLKRKGLWHLLENKWSLPYLEGENSHEALLRVGKRLGCLVQGGDVDEDMAGRRLLDAFSTGKLGRFTLDSPGDEDHWGEQEDDPGRS